MSFLEELHKGTNRSARTANGALSNTSTLNPLLDFFANAGAMRGREQEAVALFNNAFAADPENAVRCLFYLRDIRGGQGERSIFKAILRDLNKNHPLVARKVAKFIPQYGRWDEVLELLDGHDIEVAELLQHQLNEDLENMEAGKSVSLLAKWLPSGNTSSKLTRAKAQKVTTLLGIKPSKYRKMLSALRKYINLLEQSMSAKEWAEIQYGKLPSQAHRKHIKAFKRHDNARYEEYLGKVEKGEAKINSDTLFTYEVYDLVHRDHSGENTRTANAMWKALPDYTRGENALVLADVSASMSGRPMSISVSLALYFADRNEGAFKDYFMTFTSRSRLQKVTGDTLSEKMSSIERADWDGSTNLQSAFDAILAAAQSDNASADEMPRVLYVISDMQFNVATSGNNETNFEAAARKFKEAGYELPHVVFWNCNSWGNDAPATMYDNQVTLLSGSNQSTFQYAVVGKTPMQSMLDILNSERYKQITL